MKIEVNTTDETDAGIRSRRHGAVLLLASLPADEARLAIHQWTTWHEAEEEADRQAAATPAYEAVRAQEQPQPQQEPPQSEPTPQPQEPPPEPRPEPQPEPRPEPKPNGLPDAAKPSYEKFSYGNRTFSVHKRGPKAALDQAFADILGETDPAKLLGPLALKLSGLVGIFEEIGRKDLAAQITPALEKRKAEFAGVTAKAGGKGFSEATGSVVAIPAPAGGDEHIKVDLTRPAEEPIKTSDVLVGYKGQQLRQDIARAMCLNHIRACADIEALDQLSREADRLADQLDDLGPLAGRYASEIRDCLSTQTDELAAKTQPAEPLQSQATATAKLKTMPQPPVQPANGGGNGSEEPETLRHLLRRAEHEFGRRWVSDLLRKYGAATVKGLDKANEPLVRAAALERLSQAG